MKLRGITPAATIRDLIESYNPAWSLSEASTPPSSWYTAPEIFELEKTAVFRRSWVVVGRAEQVREPGEFLTAEIAGEPILIVRAKDGVLRGFFNVCRHHAAAVLTAPQGRAENLRCPYHGWTYDLEGALIHTPEFGGAIDFDRAANGLVPVEVAQWECWVFAKLQPGAPPLNEFIGKELIEQFRGLEFEQFTWFERRSYTLQCNWKVFVDNYLDGGYHVPHIHRDLNSVLTPGQYKIETGSRHCLQWSALAGGAGASQTASVRAGDRALYYWIYPNFMINIYADVMDTNLVLPLAVDRTGIIFDYYFADVSESAHERNLASIAVSEQIQNEDAAVCESVQRGLASSAFDTGRLAPRREAGEHLFHRLLHSDFISGLSEK